MKNIWFKIILFLFFGISCTHEYPKFYEKVLSRLNHPHSNYILLDIQSSDYIGKAIIKNSFLYWYFNKREGITEGKYKSMMIKILGKKETIHINDPKDIEKWGFEKVIPDKEVDESELKGKSYFLDKYTYMVLNNRILKPIEDYNKRKAIIAKLFEMGIAIYIDDESGAAIIDSVPFMVSQLPKVCPEVGS